MKNLEKFALLGLSQEMLKALEKKGFNEPTPIQEKTIPLLLNSQQDVVAQAQTGTGKTAAFGIPILENLSEKNKNVQALILTPTRELAVQVSEEINSLKGNKKLKVLPVYGGQSIEQQLKKLQKGIDIVVGTPGRILDHLRRGSLVLNQISYLILDEADEMLNMGFIEDIEEILRNTNSNKRMLLFSATMPKDIIRIAKKYMGKYKLVTVENENLTVPLTDQIYFEVTESNKLDALCRIIDIAADFYGLVFCRTKLDVDEVSKKLMDRGYNADALHGDLSQVQREKILLKFRNGRIKILVATDVAARGIDINNLTHVINYALPQDPESYVHRIGRTGRAGKEGTAITFVTPAENRRLHFIRKITKTDIRKEKLPGVRDVINSKKLRISQELDKILTEQSYSEYLEMARNLLNNSDPEKMLAALLKFSFQDELHEGAYKEIPEISSDFGGETRLFIALGRMDGLTPKKLVGLIKKEANVRDRKIRNARVLDKYSYFNVPTKEVNHIIKMFKKRKRGNRLLVEVARS
ncbi:MAG: DEAD/DEAH box helicase [Calditrichia bacterium]